MTILTIWHCRHLSVKFSKNIEFHNICTSASLGVNHITHHILINQVLQPVPLTKTKPATLITDVSHQGWQPYQANQYKGVDLCQVYFKGCIPFQQVTYAIQYAAKDGHMTTPKGSNLNVLERGQFWSTIDKSEGPASEFPRQKFGGKA